jgi:hypothetical protein
LVLINNTTIAFNGENECTTSDHLELVKVASARLQALSLQCQLSGQKTDVHRPSPTSNPTQYPTGYCQVRRARIVSIVVKMNNG